MIVTPLVLLWRENPHLNWTRDQIIELAFLFLGLFSTVWIVFGGHFHSEIKNYPLEYLCIPFLIWAAFRFGRRKAATATCVLAGVAIWGTLHGFGPFSRETLNTSLLLVQSFVGIVAMTSLALAAEVSERKRADERVQQLVATDALTGLANYRRLMEAVELEIKRYGRSGRPFAILLLDLDRLKKLNDTHGHLVGSRALCRLAEVLKAHCREWIRRHDTEATSLLWCFPRHLRRRPSRSPQESVNASPPMEKLRLSLWPSAALFSLMMGTPLKSSSRQLIEACIR